MKTINIPSTKCTPEINFDPSGILSINGRSYAEDSAKFYESLNLWIFEYIQNPQDITILNIDVDYMNSSSTKCIFLLMKEIIDIAKKDKTIIINWYYTEDDPETKELGEYFKQSFNFPINFLTK